MKSKSLFILTLALCLFHPELFPQKVAFSGQLSAMEFVKPGTYWNSITGVRYMPEIKWNMPVNKTWKFDLEASANASGQIGIEKHDTLYTNFYLKPYRVWGRMASERFELRLGLQKINFGSATMLRPLMWFDHMDPRDPLQMTDGVYAVLGRYFFQNNANLWLWGVLPGKTIKGWEILRSDLHRPEFGGRIQVPAGKGELALSGHFRYLGTDQTGAPLPITLDKPVPEYRLGLDGKWDIGPGVWFEGTYTWKNLPQTTLNHIRMLTVGTDYTFGVGNGLTFTSEEFLYQTGSGVFQTTSELNFTALSLTYPINITHSLSAIVFYNWSANNWYRFVNWQIRLKKTSLYVIAFWNPESFNLYQTTGNTSLMGGKGLQLLFVWNH
jgi:hypothetical protein